MATRRVEEYLALPYTIEVQSDRTETFSGWFARVKELPGCMTQAASFDELGPMIEDAMRAWIEVALEDGEAVPEPAPKEQYSGKFVLRVSRSLHRQLVENADVEGVSLNQYCNTVLALALGQTQRGESDAKERRRQRPYRQTGHATQHSGVQTVGEEKPAYDPQEDS